jgi:nitrite reductase/ring-hydroxylating ferredoxin subunit
MAHWIRIASVDDCPPGKCIEVVAEDRVVALFNVGGVFHALDGICPHQGGPLGQGTLGQGAQACIVTCPWHGWQFDVTTGQHQLGKSVVQPRFDVRVEASAVLVDFGDGDLGIAGATR